MALIPSQVSVEVLNRDLVEHIARRSAGENVSSSLTCLVKSLGLASH